MRHPSDAARQVFGGAVALALIAAIVASVAAETPDPVPSYALDSPAVYHLEIALAMFVVAYAGIAAVWLAWQGRAFTKLTGPAGIGAEAEALNVTSDAVATLQQDVITPLSEAIDDLEHRLIQAGL
jgi:hypothetical protein